MSDKNLVSFSDIFWHVHNQVWKFSEMIVSVPYRQFFTELFLKSTVNWTSKTPKIK